jgi:hypothetical protein
MKKYNLEPTNENIIKSLSDNIIQRNSDLIDFLRILDDIDGNFFVSLDGEWGSGKTFFVKQLEIILNYFRNINYGFEIDCEIDNIINNNDKLKQIELKNCYLPVYYNAWLYDNHSDPILSLIYSISQNNKTIDVKTQSDFKNKLINIMQSIDFWHISDIGKVFNNLQSENILNHIVSLEEVKRQINDILDNLINENCDKLIIIIDELDRCNPNYAVMMLERIKHFFSDDRIVFVLAVNKSQLIHTVSNCYGINFDSSGYLNKFFDFNIKLNKVNISSYVQSMKLIGNNGMFFNKMTYEILKYMDFSLRDASIYIQQISLIEKIVSNLNNTYSYICAMFIPIIIAYRIADVNKSILLENGKGVEILDSLIRDLDFFKKMVARLANTMTTQQDENIKYENGRIEFFKIYDYIFANSDNNGWYQGSFELERGIKDDLMKICNTQKIY